MAPKVHESVTHPGSIRLHRDMDRRDGAVFFKYFAKTSLVAAGCGHMLDAQISEGFLRMASGIMLDFKHESLNREFLFNFR